MLGPAKLRRREQPFAVSLDDLVPRDHSYRHLKAKLDLGFVRDWVRELYADRGRPSIDPVVQAASSSFVHVSRVLPSPNAPCVKHVVVRRAP